jgi:hypothetical protein
MDPLTKMQTDILMKIAMGEGGSGPNLSGYNNALSNLEAEKTRINDRYKKYSGQISDIYGTLTGITQSDIANIAPAGERVRSTLSAQEAERAAATRAADEARLATATEARAALGLEDIAGQYAGGDIATEQAEGMVTDSAAQASAAENTLLANEAIAQQSGQNRITGYGLQQEESSRQLQRSLEDALAAIRAEQAQIEMQRSQAASSGSGPDYGAQLSAIEMLQGMGQEAPATDFIGQWMQNNRTAAVKAAPALNSFNNFILTNYDKLFNENGLKKVDPNVALQRFMQIASPADLDALKDPTISLFLSGYFNSFGQTPKNAFGAPYTAE